MGEIERFKESDGLGNIIHPYESQVQRFQFIHMGNHLGFAVERVIGVNTVGKRCIYSVDQ